MPIEGELAFEPTEASTAAPDLPAQSFSTGGETPEPAPSQSVQQPAPQPEPQQLTIRDVAAQLGYTFPGEIADDYTALAHLTQQARQAQQLSEAQRQQDVYAQLGRQLAPHAQQVGQFLQQQQAPAGPKPWEPPQFDERWISQVVKDEASGMYVAKAGANPEIAKAVNEYVDWQARFMRNPASVLTPLLEDYKTQAVAAAREEIWQSLAQTQSQANVQRIVADNSRWFYAMDAQGQYVIDPITRQAQPSPLGIQYLSTVRALAARGVQDPVYRDEIAKAILEQGIQAATGTSTVDQTAQARQQQATKTRTRNVNPLQALAADQRQHVAGSTAPDQQGLSLGDRLRQQFKQNGITDEMILMP